MYILYIYLFVYTYTQMVEYVVSCLKSYLELHLTCIDIGKGHMWSHISHMLRQKHDI